MPANCIKQDNSDRRNLVGNVENDFSYCDGKTIPLIVTCLQLSWGSIRLGKNAHKSIHIKNTSEKRLVIRMDISGPGFQIVNFHSNIIYLQAQECRSICLNFCATVIGAAIGVLSFSSPNSPAGQTFLDIPLYGYGGTASLTPEKCIRRPVGTPFLPMGEVKDLATPLEKTFKIYNKGPLYGFAVILVDTSGLDMSRLCDAFHVTPKRVIVPPGELVTIRVTFIPRCDDVKHIIKKISNVMTLAHLRLICGDEPTRQRIRNLIRIMNDEDKLKLRSRVLDNIWVRIPGEKPIDGLEKFKEKSEVALDLVSKLRVHDIALTLNKIALPLNKTVLTLNKTATTLNKTATTLNMTATTVNNTADSTLVFPDADETAFFGSFTPALSSTQKIDPVNEEQEQAIESWSVQPKTLVYHPPMIFSVKNDSNKAQLFEISSTYDLFRFEPSKTYVEPGKEIKIEVLSQSEKPGILPKADIDIYVKSQNKRVSIPVKDDKNYYSWNRS